MDATEVYKDKAGDWRFRVKAANGKIFGVSSAYATEAAARRGVEALWDALDMEAGKTRM